MVLSRDVKVLRIHPEKSVHFLHIIFMWRSKEQFLDMVIPGSRLVNNVKTWTIVYIGFNRRQ